VLTLTCGMCNNEFGSKFEPHLLDWYDGSLGSVRLSNELVNGRRFAGEFLVREDAEGSFVLFQKGNQDPAVARILSGGGQFSMHYSELNTARVHVAAVKSAYLAACVALREVPRTPRSEELRLALVAARDSPRDARIDATDLMKSIRIGRLSGEPLPGEIRLMATRPDAGRVVISFNRVVAIDWPLEPITGFHLESNSSPSPAPSD
jgi:hypothetical protein